MLRQLNLKIFLVIAMSLVMLFFGYNVSHAGGFGGPSCNVIKTKIKGPSIEMNLVVKEDQYINVSTKCGKVEGSVENASYEPTFPFILTIFNDYYTEETIDFYTLEARHFKDFEFNNDWFKELGLTVCAFCGEDGFCYYPVKSVPHFTRPEPDLLEIKIILSTKDYICE